MAHPPRFSSSFATAGRGCDMPHGLVGGPAHHTLGTARERVGLVLPKEFLVTDPGDAIRARR